MNGTAFTMLRAQFLDMLATLEVIAAADKPAGHPQFRSKASIAKMASRALFDAREQLRRVDALNGGAA